MPEFNAACEEGEHLGRDSDADGEENKEKNEEIPSSLLEDIQINHMRTSSLFCQSWDSSVLFDEPEGVL